MKVNFVIIGAQKSGTTSLSFQLAQHPQICASRPKEPDYFSRERNRESDLARYHALFKPGDGQLCFEASTAYTFLPEYPRTADRLRAYNPELKLIYIMRQPVERIVSHYLHRLRLGKVLRSPKSEVLRNPIYVDRSRYGVQLGPYCDLFPVQNILPLVFEDYLADTAATLDRVAGFLGVSREGFAGIDLTPKYRSEARGFPGERELDSLLRGLRLRSSQKPRKTLYRKVSEGIEFSPDLRAALWQLLEEDVCRIEKLLGRRLDVWRNS